jgi:hypothetical protein
LGAPADAALGWAGAEPVLSELIVTEVSVVNSEMHGAD